MDILGGSEVWFTIFISSLMQGERYQKKSCNNNQSISIFIVYNIISKAFKITHVATFDPMVCYGKKKSYTVLVQCKS